MADDNTNPGSGAPGASGGAGAAGGQQGDSPNQGDNSKKMVAWDDHQRVLADMHKEKNRARDLEAKLAENATAAAEKNGDYQKLYEAEKAKAGDLSKQLKDVIGFNANTHRFNEVKSKAAAAGLRKEAVKDLELLDLSPLPVELTNRNRYIVEGVDGFVDQLKTEKPHWFQSLQAPPFNPGGGGAPPGPKGNLTANDVANAEIDFRKGRKTKAEYEAVHNEYAKQQRQPKTS